MKNAFTLIELMVSLIIGMLLINFTFSYQFSFLQELKYLEAKENLAMESFKLSEIIAKGIKYEDTEIPGLIHASKIYENKKYRRKDDFITVRWKLSMDNHYQEFESYKYKRVSINTNTQLNNVKDKNGDRHDLMSLKLDLEMPIKVYGSTISNPRYDNYVRLVYTR